MENGFSRLIAEFHVSKLNGAFYICQPLHILRLGGFLRFVQQGENALRCGKRRKQLVDHIGKFIDGSGEFPGIEHEGGNGIQSHCAVHIQYGSQYGNQGKRKVIDEAHGGAHGAAVEFGIVISIRGLCVYFVEPLTDGVFIGIGLNVLFAGEHFLHETVHAAVAFGAAAIAWADLFPHEGGIAHGNGNGHQGDDGQGGGEVDHHEERANHRHQAGHDLGHIRGDAGGDHIHIIGNPADDIACGVVVVIAHRQVHQLLKDIHPHFPGHPFAQIGHAHIDDKGHGAGGHIHKEHPRGVEAHLLKIDPSHACGCLVDGKACVFWPHEGENVADKAQKDNGKEQVFIAGKVLKGSPQGAPGILWPGFFGYFNRHSPIPPLPSVLRKYPGRQDRLP